jgi:ABC-type transport system involved in multi-copper enzyme maturation permease subunit
MTNVATIVGYALGEALRRRVFLVVLLLTLVFLFLYWLGNHYVFRDIAQVQPPEGVNVRDFVGSFVFGLSMFATLFLGVVLAIFLTLGAVSGDAERGLLQPLVVRPIGRSTFLVSRWLGASLVCIPYVLAVYFAGMLITGIVGDWWPDRIVLPGFELAAAVVVVAALSLLGSVFLSSTANGIAVFMIFGAGLVAGLLGSIGHALPSRTLTHAAKITSWALPFEALYQDALHAITENTFGFTRFLIRLGPFGGAENGGYPLRLYAVAYLVVIGVVTLAAFRRRDL